MNNPSDGAVAVFAQRIGLFLGRRFVFVRNGNHAPTQRLGRIIGIQKAHVIRRHGDRESFFAAPQHFGFRRRQVQNAFNLFPGSETVFNLPAPVIPLCFGSFGKIRVQKNPGTFRNPHCFSARKPDARIGRILM